MKKVICFSIVIAEYVLFITKIDLLIAISDSLTPMVRCLYVLLVLGVNLAMFIICLPGEIR